MKFLKDLYDVIMGQSKHDARAGAALTPEQERMNRLLASRAEGRATTAAQAVHAEKMAAAHRAIAARAASARGSAAPLAAREAMRQQAELAGEAAAEATELRAQEEQAYAALATGQYAEQHRQRMQAEALNAQTWSENAARAQTGFGTLAAAAAAAASPLSDVREKTDVRPVRDFRKLAREAALASSAVARLREEEAQPRAPLPPVTSVLPEVRAALARRAPEAPPRPVPQWLRDEAAREGWDQPAAPPTEERAQDAPGWQQRGIDVLMRAAADKDGGLEEAKNAWNWRYKRRARERLGLPPDEPPRVGVMAQDLARSRVGRDAVVRDPVTGRLALDRDRALQLALGAAAAAHRRLDEQEEAR